MDEYLDIQVRPNDEIAARILIQYALVQRVYIEELITEIEIDEEDDPDDLYYDLQVFLVESGVRPWLNTKDRTYLERRPGGLSQLETSVLLEDAAGLEPLLSVMAPELAAGDDNLGELNVRRLAVLFHALTDERAARVRELAELVHWRVAVEIELRETRGSERQTLRTLIQETAAEASNAGLIERTARNDIDIGGRNIDEIEKSELTLYLVEATVRLKAMNWLCGFGSSWYDVPLEL